MIDLNLTARQADASVEVREASAFLIRWLVAAAQDLQHDWWLVFDGFDSQKIDDSVLMLMHGLAQRALVEPERPRSRDGRWRAKPAPATEAPRAVHAQPGNFHRFSTCGAQGRKQQFLEAQQDIPHDPPVACTRQKSHRPGRRSSRVAQKRWTLASLLRDKVPWL